MSVDYGPVVLVVVRREIAGRYSVFCNLCRKTIGNYAMPNVPQDAKKYAQEHYKKEHQYTADTADILKQQFVDGSNVLKQYFPGRAVGNLLRVLGGCIRRITGVGGGE